MATTRISYLSSVTEEAFLDELEKIASETGANVQEPTNSQKFKKWLKNAALISAGTAAGTGAFMVGEKYLGPHISKKWNAISPNTRVAIAGPAILFGNLITALALRKMEEEKNK
jgi:hypothetical protein